MKRRRIQLPSLPSLTPQHSPRNLSPHLHYPERVPDHRHGHRAISPSSSSSSSSSSLSIKIMSRPASIAVMAAANRPSLQDILANAAPPPWSLGAFMAYLSQNHCLETLEFTMEADRYSATWQQIQIDEATADAAYWAPDAQEYTWALWRKLIANYIMPCGPREVNLPGRVRDRLLCLDRSAAPPSPAELDEAVRIVYELMNDSVLLSFFDAMQQQEQYYYQPVDDDHHEHYEQYDARQGRSRSRRNEAQRQTQTDASRSPKPSFLPQLSLGRSRSPSASSGDDHAFSPSDASGASTPPLGEPITPPTTPPTSDWNFSTSPPGPNGLQRAITVHNAGWKRMSQKLGLSKSKDKKRRPNNTSSGSNGSQNGNSNNNNYEGSMSVSPTDGYMDEHYGQGV